MDKYILNSSYISEQTKNLIFAVFDKMPLDIVEFVLKNIGFFEFKLEKSKNSKKNAIAYCLQINDPARFHIVFDSEFYKLPDRVKKYVIAHEIGHAYLRHEDQDESEEQNEKEADAFAAKYGFEGKRELSIRDISHWSLKTWILVILIILFWALPIYVDKIAHLLQWTVFI